MILNQYRVIDEYFHTRIEEESIQGFFVDEEIRNSIDTIGYISAQQMGYFQPFEALQKPSNDEARTRKIQYMY